MPPVADPNRRPEATHVVLIGLPGSGKTTVGRALAKHLERSFVDIDAEVERLFGMDILEIFSVKGEPVFRSAEVDVSRRLAQFPLLVVASGGGWAANRPAVAHLRPISRIIYLRVSPKEALRRMGVEIAGRPLFATGHPEEVMQRLYETRRMVYEEVADIIVDADASGMDELVTMIAKLL